MLTGNRFQAYSPLAQEQILLQESPILAAILNLRPRLEF